MEENTFDKKLCARQYFVMMYDNERTKISNGNTKINEAHLKNYVEYNTNIVYKNIKFYKIINITLNNNKSKFTITIKNNEETISFENNDPLIFKNYRKENDKENDKDTNQDIMFKMFTNANSINHTYTRFKFDTYDTDKRYNMINIDAKNNTLEISFKDINGKSVNIIIPLTIFSIKENNEFSDKQNVLKELIDNFKINSDEFRTKTENMENAKKKLNNAIKECTKAKNNFEEIHNTSKENYKTANENYETAKENDKTAKQNYETAKQTISINQEKIINTFNETISQITYGIDKQLLITKNNIK